ncbi:DDE-type integrase/transposase/recombinase [Aduncisulcus paluster]|uniref:DDE-type integrase/transposase/recombinase n=1 Tax=Aduncisulcus paluster TaxID=2918883 RepID=A0ABQ5KTB7_9EUKA|nr:DDE-type integrase/transposase/recombinase [Aduncisulcus paluster]
MSSSKLREFMLELSPIFFGTRFQERGKFTYITGPLPEDANGFKYLLVVVDSFTRFIEIIPVISVGSEEAAMALLTYIFGRYGTPMTIRSDNGSQFKNGLHNCLSKALGYTQKFTLPHHHRENGMVERAIGSIRRLLRIERMQKDERDYSVFAAVSMQIINRRLHSSIGMSPYEALFGKRMREETGTVHDWGEPPQETLEEHKVLHRANFYIEGAREAARAHQLKLYQRRRTAMERNIEEPLKVGDLVLIDHEESIPTKDAPRMRGPWRVVEIISKWRVRIENLQGHNAQEIGVDRTRKVTLRESEEELLRVQSRDEGEWEVAEIVGHRYGRRRAIRFKITWKGFPDEEPADISWDEAKSLKEQMDIYLEKNPTLKRRLGEKSVKLR